METLLILIVFVFLIFSAFAIFKVKSGQNKNFGEAFSAVCREFYKYCNTSEITVSSAMFPPPIDEHLWLGFEKKIKNKFVDVDFSTFCVGNGVCGAEFYIIMSATTDTKILRQMLEKSLQNYLLKVLNLYINTCFSTFIYLSGNNLQIYYAISYDGLKFIQNQKRNERSRQKKRN